MATANIEEITLYKNALLKKIIRFVRFLQDWLLPL